MWAGICLTVSVTSSAPPVSAEDECRCPWWIGIRPRRSGSAKVTRRRRRRSCRSAGTGSRSRRSAAAVPRRTSSRRARSCRANIRISPTYGWAIGRLLSSGDGKMPWRAMQKFSVRNGCMFRCAWLPPTLVTDAGSHRRPRLPASRRRCWPPPRNVAGRASAVPPSLRVTPARRGVCWRQLGNRQRVRLLAAALAERVAAARRGSAPARAGPAARS